MTPVVIVDDKQPKSEPQHAQHDSNVYGAVYMNDLARLTTLGESKANYPVGAAIVREKLLTATSETPEIIAAMIKREKGFNPAANDWEFLVINGSMTKIKKRQKTGECQLCHAAEKDKDYVFRAQNSAFTISQ